MQVVKVKAPAHFASFCEALNEPFYFSNGAYYLVGHKDPRKAREFCADNGMRSRDLDKMEFEKVTLTEYNGHWLEEDPVEKFFRDLEECRLAVEDLATGSRYDGTALEAEALAAYRRELNEYGSADMSREAFIDDYIAQHS